MPTRKTTSWSDGFVASIDRCFTPRCKHPVSSQKLFLALSIAVAPLLSGCVGNAVNDTLDSAALNSPTQLAPSEQVALVDYQSLSAVPVPVRSPKSGELALLNSATSPVADAAAQLANQSTQDGMVAEANEATPVQTASLSNAAANSQDVPAAQAKADLSSNAASSAQSATASVAPAIKPKPPSLFGALFGNRNKSQTAQKKPPAPAATVQTARASGSANPLPGVKRDSALFGIGEETDSKRKEPISDNAVRVASVGSFGRFKTVNGLILQTSRVQVDCFKPELMRILRIVERRYGKKVMVTSGFRSASANRRAGGARNSTHIYCKAADIQVDGISKWDLAKFLRTVNGRGGVGTYCRTKSVHIDVGSVRDWHHPCRRSKSRAKKRKT